MLKAMNERITVYLDREHQIGHTYLIGVTTIDGLAEIFQRRIVPLLQEYFYDDWKKIRLVLNENPFIHEREIETPIPDDRPERPVFELLAQDDDEWQKPESYRTDSSRAGKAPLQATAYLRMIGKHRHPHRPETNRTRESDYPVNVSTFFEFLPREFGLTPCRSALAPSRILRALIVYRETTEPDEIEQIFRSRSNRPGQIGPHLDDSIGKILESRLGVVTIRPDVPVP